MTKSGPRVLPRAARRTFLVMMPPFLVTPFLVMLVLVTLGCNGPANDGPANGNSGKSAAAAGRAGPLRVYTVNYPLQYFAERIGGEHVEAVFPAPADEDPAYWMPDADSIEAFQQADLILLNGAGYAKWRDKVTLPDDTLHDTSVASKDQYIEVTDSATHTHGPGGEHAHTGIAFTTWLDLKLASEQARAVCDALAKADPEHAATFQSNLDSLQQDLAALDEQLKELTSKRPKPPLVFSHPVYQYLIRHYSLNGLSVHWEPDEVPAEKMWSELDDLLKRHDAKWMVWEAEPADETRAKLAQRGIQCAVFAPCANRPATGDFLSVMRDNVASLTRIFE